MQESRIVKRSRQLPLPVFKLEDSPFEPRKPLGERAKEWAVGAIALALWGSIFLSIFAAATQGG